MIKLTIRQSFKDLYSTTLIESFCSKYELENFKIKAEQIRYFVATSDNNIVGIIGLKDNELRTFFVHPDFQGKSIGRKLFQRLEKAVREKGIKKIVLEASPLGSPIYKHFGFEVVGSVNKVRNGVPFMNSVMEKILK